MISEYQKDIKVYLKLTDAKMDDDYLGIKSATTKQYFEVAQTTEDLTYPFQDKVTLLIKNNYYEIKKLCFFTLKKL